MAEIKISELSIGDWVYHDDLVFGREIAKVHRLNKAKNGETIGITVYRSDGAFGVVGYILTSPTNNDIYPIPLTPEILAKNGLCVVEEDADFSEYELFGSENFSIFHIKGTLRYRLETPQASVVCWNVHQLQHALRLAGVEKEIEV
jgi:hypothetical protein